MSKQVVTIKLSDQTKTQKVGNGRKFKNPDVPRKDTNPKENQDPLPPKKEKKRNNLFCNYY